MKKTYREVIRDIKKGEVWENERIKIYIDDNNKLRIIFKNVSTDGCIGIMIDLDDIFTLQRKEYDFIEAWKAYKEGKEIESLESGTKFKKIDDMNKYYMEGLKFWQMCSSMEINDISNKWYIND